jgi:hypothetical protein
VPNKTDWIRDTRQRKYESARSAAHGQGGGWRAYGARLAGDRVPGQRFPSLPNRGLSKTQRGFYRNPGYFVREADNFALPVWNSELQDQGEKPKASRDGAGRGFVSLGESSTRCHLTDEHRMQFLMHVSRTRIGIVTNSVSLCVNEDVIGEKRYIKVVVVC